MKKVIILVLLCVGIVLSVFIGRGCNSKEVTLVSDPKDIERLGPMLPSGRAGGRPGGPARPQGQQQPAPQR